MILCPFWMLTSSITIKWKIQTNRLFKISPFVFRKRKKVIQGWSNMRMIKLTELSFFFLKTIHLNDYTATHWNAKICIFYETLHPTLAVYITTYCSLLYIIICLSITKGVIILLSNLCCIFISQLQVSSNLDKRSSATVAERKYYKFKIWHKGQLQSNFCL